MKLRGRTMDELSTKDKAVLLLRQYDEARGDLRDIERELSRLCSDYGREQGMWGFTKDHLRIQLAHEEQRNANARTYSN
jgi:hypothetical protein